MNWQRPGIGHHRERLIRQMPLKQDDGPFALNSGWFLYFAAPILFVCALKFGGWW